MQEDWVDPYASDPPDDNQLAFAAYQDAWNERQRTQDESPQLLLDALRAKKVTKSEYAEGTRLHTVLFDSWQRGRKPSRMHGVILRYRFRSALALPGELVDIFRDKTPDHMKVPEEFKKFSGQSEDETELEFTPAGTFAARLPGWYDALDPEDGRTRFLTVWLDPQVSPGSAYVMVGKEVAGTTAVPLWAHEILRAAPRRGKRRVADGDLTVKKKKKDGTFKLYGLSVWLPDPNE